jgi:microsomal epoxide hydrolase
VPIEHRGKTLDIHFVALFSQKNDAPPLLLLHGWPGSFLEFVGTLELLKRKYTPDTLPFSVVVPSLPGYGYSAGPPLDADFGCEDSARMMDKLMVGLGFDSFIAQGGDIGSVLARILVSTSDHCKAAHRKTLRSAP